MQTFSHLILPFFCKHCRKVKTAGRSRLTFWYLWNQHILWETWNLKPSMCFLKHQEGQGFVKELGSEIWTSLKSCISALIRCAESSEKREKKKKYCTWGRTCPWKEGPLPSPWDMQSAGLLQSLTKVKTYHTTTPLNFLVLGKGNTDLTSSRQGQSWNLTQRYVSWSSVPEHFKALVRRDQTTKKCKNQIFVGFRRGYEKKILRP